MKPLTRHEFRELCTAPGNVCVSFYLPLGVGSDARNQARIRLKNLLRRAEEALGGRGLHAAAIRALLDPARQLAEDRLAEVGAAGGLAIFAGGPLHRTIELPFQVEEGVWVLDRFHLRPLARQFAHPARFFVLAVSQNKVRLLQGSGTELTDVDVPDLPVNLAATLHLDQPDGTFQFHTAKWGSDVKGDAAYHGQGGAADRAKEDVVRYFREIDRALRPVLQDERAPLVFAGVDSLFPLYQEANHYPHLWPTQVSGNPDRLTPAQLHEQSWPLVAPAFAQRETQALARFASLLGGDEVSDDLKTILIAAEAGRVDTLLLAEGKHVWGSFDAQSGAVCLHGERSDATEDLLDRALVATLTHGGAIYTVPPDKLEGGTPMGAIFRYVLSPATAAGATAP